LLAPQQPAGHAPQPLPASLVFDVHTPVTQVSLPVQAAHAKPTLPPHCVGDWLATEMHFLLVGSQHPLQLLGPQELDEHPLTSATRKPTMAPMANALKTFMSPLRKVAQSARRTAGLSTACPFARETKKAGRLVVEATGLAFW
jgi:hypothetical protein